MGVDPRKMKNVLDLKEIWRDYLQNANDVSIPTINGMSLELLGKKPDLISVLKSADSSSSDIIDEAIVNFSALSAAIRLKIFFEIEDTHNELKMKYYDYVKPKGVEKTLGIEKSQKREKRDKEEPPRNYHYRQTQDRINDDSYGHYRDKEINRGGRGGFSSNKGGYGAGPARRN